MRRPELLAAMVVAALAGCTTCTISPGDRQYLTKADLRTISEGLWHFHDDGGAYPVTGSTLASFDTAIGNLLVEGEYIRKVPVEPWGGSFGYWSDGEHFIVVSSGPNKHFDLEYAQVAQEENLEQPNLLCDLISPSNDDYVSVDGLECLQDL